jgi:hypothetical protein
MVNQMSMPEMKVVVDRLADLNAALKEHARRFCGTELRGDDWQALQKLIVAREQALLWLAEQDLFIDDRSNVWKAPR